MSCEVFLNDRGKDWVWYCAVCDKKGEPVDVITAYWGALVHKGAAAENEELEGEE